MRESVLLFDQSVREELGGKGRTQTEKRLKMTKRVAGNRYRYSASTWGRLRVGRDYLGEYGMN